MTGAEISASLIGAARAQLRWSIIAGSLKGDLKLWRLMALGLALTGAVLETLAAHFYPSPLTGALGLGGAVILALVPFTKKRLLDPKATQAWIRARAASEALKREIYFYRTATEPYHPENPDRDRELLRRQQDINEGVSDLERHSARVGDLQVSLNKLGPLTARGYIEERIKGQLDFYRRTAAKLDGTQRRFSTAELGLGALAVVLGALAAVFGWLAAWVAVVTTAAVALAAHIAAERFEEQVVAYLATARRLDGLMVQWQITEVDAAATAQLVKDCEAAIQGENQGWIAYWSKDPLA